MKKSIYKFLGIALLATSCSESNEPDNGSLDVKDTRFEAIASNYLENTVIITYTSLAYNAEQLVKDLETLRVSKNDAGVKKACESFLEARKWWERSEADRKSVV